VCGALFSELRRDVRRLVRGRSVVLIGIVSWFLLEGVQLSPVLRTFSQSTYDYCILCVALSLAGFLIGYHVLRPSTFFEPVAQQLIQLDNPSRLWRVVVACAAIGFAPVLYYSGFQLLTLMDGILGMRSSWGGLIARGRYGGFRDAMLMLEQFALGAGAISAILLFDKRAGGLRRIACAGFTLWPLLRAYGSGTRSTMITAVLPVLAVVYFRSPARWQKAFVWAGICSIPVLYTFMAAMVISRGSGEFRWSDAEKAEYVGSEMLQELAYIVTNVPESVPYQAGYSYFVQVVNPIPRFLWPGKPTLDSGILMAQVKGMVNKDGEVFLTNSPGLIGEMYLNFGIAGVFALSLLGGWLTRAWDLMGERYAASISTMIFYSMGLGVLFILGRSFTMNMFYSMLFLYVGVRLMNALVPQNRQAATLSQVPARPSL
jgi:oligosaccharide repeat unit polymerase